MAESEGMRAQRLRKAFLAALACMGLASLAEPVFPAIMKSLLDDGFSKANGPWDWLLYPLAIMGIFLVRAILVFSATT